MQAQREEATSANDDADTEDTAMPVNVLEAHGIGAADVKKLREAGYHTVQSVTFAPKKALLVIKGISDAKADKIIHEAQQLVPSGFSTATEVHLKRANIIQVNKSVKSYKNALNHHCTNSLIYS